MSTLYILIGNVGSGKSTWAKNNLPDAKVIDGDCLRYMFNKGEYKFEEKLESLIFYTERMLIDEMLYADYDVIYDNLNHTKRKRKQALSLIHYAEKIVAVNFFNNGVKGRLKDSRGIPASKWIELHKQFDNEYEPPTLDEGFDEIIEVKE